MASTIQKIGSPLGVMLLLTAAVFVFAHTNNHEPNGTMVTVTKYEGRDCTGAEVSRNTFPAATCLVNTSVVNAKGSFEYHCHHVVRPTCAFLRLNCTHGNTNGRVEELPCEICSVSGLMHPTVYNFSCSSSPQTAILNTNCTDRCGSCNQSIALSPGECSAHGNGISSELIRVGPCLEKVMTVSFSEDKNCSGKRHISGLIASGECDNRRSETRVCHTIWKEEPRLVNIWKSGHARVYLYEYHNVRYWNINIKYYSNQCTQLYYTIL